jgi:hypothetical protein
MTKKLVSQLNENGYFVGITEADESPLEPGVYLFPAGTVDTPAPSTPENKIAKWDGVWVFEDILLPESELLVLDSTLSSNEILVTEL